MQLTNEMTTLFSEELRVAEERSEEIMVEVEADQAALKAKWDSKMELDARIWSLKNILGIKDEPVDTGAAVTTGEANEV